MFTPGPWTVSPPSGTGEPDSVKQYQGMPYKEHSMVHAQNGDFIKNVAHVYQGDGGVGSPEALAEQLANARLIAAAPDMYEALATMLGVAEADCVDDQSNVWRSAMIHARHALESIETPQSSKG